LVILEHDISISALLRGQAMENDEQPVYDQRNQQVDTQHNAGRDVNVNQRYPQREPSRQQGGDQYNAGRDVNIFERIQNVLFSPTDAQQRRNRVTMLEKIRTYWIEGYLEQSLHKAALIELGMEYKPDALEYPWEMVVQSPDRPSEPVPRGTTIADVFDQFSGELLILGSPGTGKTTMLLELTRILIRRAEADEYHPIPVVFNLSSWAVKRQRLDKWLIEELNSRYDVPKGVARSWLQYNQVLPLLDGLDEVRQDQREACIDAINDYKAKRAQGVAQVAVCSRIADYEVLTKKLRLQGAVLLHTLTDQQIEDALQQLGKRGERVRTVLQNLRENAHRYQDTEAEELTRTPLLLSITTLAYQGKSDEELPPPDAPPGVT
jgi:energy-coupling factor transporter ATP-binding protein EcfA2